jgi:alpha-1,6-mannosyltransferase
MRIADVSAFYTPTGGGVRTYANAKLRVAARLGHEMILIVPGERHEVIPQGPGAVLVTLPSPLLPVDRRYRYFDDEALIHATLDEWQPDHVEASSPWSSAAMVGRWQGGASRSLVMHADPLAAYVITASVLSWNISLIALAVKPKAMAKNRMLLNFSIWFWE